MLSFFKLYYPARFSPGPLDSLIPVRFVFSYSWQWQVRANLEATSYEFSMKFLLRGGHDLTCSFFISENSVLHFIDSLLDATSTCQIWELLFLTIFPSQKNLAYTLANMLKFSKLYSDLEKIMREEAKDDHTFLNKIDH